MRASKYQAIVMGASAGGLEALINILTRIDAGFPCPIFIVQHLHPDSNTRWIEILDNKCKLRVKEAERFETIKPGTVYIAPPDYHLVFEDERTLDYVFDDKVWYSRPSVDVLFESASSRFFSSLIGVILTGANADGADGMKLIKERGGFTIAQDPKTAHVDVMPRAAIDSCPIDLVLEPAKIADILMRLVYGSLIAPWNQDKMSI